MDDQRLSCRMTYIGWNIAALVFLALGGMYTTGVVYLWRDASENPGVLIAWAIAGLAVVILVPLLASTVRARVVIEQPGLRLWQRAFFSFLSREQSIAWSDIMCWDSRVAFLPITRGEHPRITLYTRARPLRIDATGKPFFAGNEVIPWERFKERLESLLRSQGLPEATPDPALMRDRALRKAFVVAMATIGMVLVLSTVISVMRGRASYPVIVATTLMFLLIARSGKWFFKR